MAVKRCLKCGAEIPEEAQFCPSCGAPKGTEAIRDEAMQPSSAPQQQQTPPPPPPPQQQNYQYQQAQRTGDPLKDLAKTFFSIKMIVIAICIGVLLLLVAAGIQSFVQPEAWDDDTVRHAASFLQSLAYYGIGLILICGGIVNSKLDKYFRLGLIIAGALILG